jgi:hypothetical protein
MSLNACSVIEFRHLGKYAAILYTGITKLMSGCWPEVCCLEVGSGPDIDCGWETLLTLCITISLKDTVSAGNFPDMPDRD